MTADKCDLYHMSQLGFRNTAKPERSARISYKTLIYSQWLQEQSTASKGSYCCQSNQQRRLAVSLVMPIIIMLQGADNEAGRGCPLDFAG